MSILFFSEEPRIMPVGDNIRVHVRPLSTPDLLATEAIWSCEGFDNLLAALKYAGPKAVVRIEGLQGVNGKAVEEPSRYDEAWFERLNPEGVSAILRAIVDAANPGGDVPNA